MGWEVKTDVADQGKQGLWGPNVKRGNYLPRGCWGLISCTFWTLKVILLGELIQLELTCSKIVK